MEQWNVTKMVAVSPCQGWVSVSISKSGVGRYCVTLVRRTCSGKKWGCVVTEEEHEAVSNLRWPPLLKIVRGVPFGTRLRNHLNRSWPPCHTRSQLLLARLRSSLRHYGLFNGRRYSAVGRGQEMGGLHSRTRNNAIPAPLPPQQGSLKRNPLLGRRGTLGTILSHLR